MQNGRKSAPRGMEGGAKNGLEAARGAGLVIIRVVGTGNMVTAPLLEEFFERQREAGFRRFVFDLSLCRSLDSTFMGCMVGMCTALSKDPSYIGPGIGAGKGPAAALATPANENENEPVSPDQALAFLQDKFDSQATTSLARTTPSTGVDVSIFQAVPPKDGPGMVLAVNVSEEVQELLNILGVDKFVRLSGMVELNALEMTTIPAREMPPEKRRELVLKAHENLVEIDKRNEEKFGAFLKTLSAELARHKKE